MGVLLIITPIVCVAGDDVVHITAEQWALPRHGERLLNMPALKQVYTQWSQDPHQVIEIRYPGGEEGELWLQELQDWLIALGIASDHIQSLPGSGAKDIISCTVRTTGGIKP